MTKLTTIIISFAAVFIHVQSQFLDYDYPLGGGVDTLGENAGVLDGTCVVAGTLVGGAVYFLGQRAAEDAMRQEMNRCVLLDTATNACLNGNCLVKGTTCVAKCIEENLKIGSFLDQF